MDNHAIPPSTQPTHSNLPQVDTSMTVSDFAPSPTREWQMAVGEQQHSHLSQRRWSPAPGCCSAPQTPRRPLHLAVALILQSNLPASLVRRLVTTRPPVFALLHTTYLHSACLPQRQTANSLRHSQAQRPITTMHNTHTNTTLH